MNATYPGSLWHSLLAAPEAWFLTGLLAIAVPLLGLRLYRRLAAGDSARPGAKSRVYLRIIAGQWLLVAGLAIVCGRHGVTAAHLGERMGDPGTTLGVSVAVLLGLAVMAVVNVRRLRVMNLKPLEEALRRLERILPSSPSERLLFGMLALTAGICEELLYRGWLIPFLGALTGSIWLGTLIGAAIFGLAHSYQGPRGIAATGVLGLAFSAIYLGVGSLYPVQLFHFGIDLVNGAAAAGAIRRLEAAREADAR